MTDTPESPTRPERAKPGKTVPKPVVLCILDGWGYREERENNAIALAHTPAMDRLWRDNPHALIDASEHYVGLPKGQMGNSEVGHMNIGAGRVVLQELPRIDKALKERALAGNEVLAAFVAALKDSGGTAHLMGLMSPGGVHSHQRHIAALANHLRSEAVPVKVHAFLDGRDTPPRSALDYLKSFEKDAPDADIATVSGRYYAMDRDKRWDRVARAYAALVDAEGERAASPRQAVQQGYDAGQNDEFLLPSVVEGYAGMADGDGVLMANFRADRVREILTALLDPDFDGFERKRTVDFAAAAGMVEYSAALNRRMDALFPPQAMTHTLGEVVAEAGLKQLRIAETEKYAHVTFFLNGGREEDFAGEERILVPSAQVATYDLQPEMSAQDVTDRLIECIEQARFDLIVVNYANGDMVGHSGKLEAAIAAAEAVDACIGRLSQAVETAGGAMLITADHGNAEQMADPATGQAHTAHTMNRVPVILTGAADAMSRFDRRMDDGRLCDIAPTVLTLMGLNQPEEMTGQSLLRGAARASAAE